MAIKNKLEKLEREARFTDWLRFHRYLDFVSDEQLEAFAVLGYFPDPEIVSLPCARFPPWKCERRCSPGGTHYHGLLHLWECSWLCRVVRCSGYSSKKGCPLGSPPWCQIYRSLEKVFLAIDGRKFT
jgi:hypothetical protein